MEGREIWLLPCVPAQKTSRLYPSQGEEEGLTLLLENPPTQGSYLPLHLWVHSPVAGRIKSHVIEVAS